MRLDFKKDFEPQIKRLASMWPNEFKQVVRLERIYQVVKDLSGSNFEALCNDIIDGFNRPPTVNDFKLLMAGRRELQHEARKHQSEQDAKAFFRSDIPDKEVKDRMTFILSRMQGSCPDKDWNDFVDKLKTEDDEAVRRQVGLRDRPRLIGSGGPN